MVLDEPVAGAPAQPDPAVPRVLVVDDEEAVMLTIQGILELEGYAVTAVPTGELALELLRAERFDVVLTDLRLEITARDEFLATVSHDLKSPLTFIKGMANLRRRRAPVNAATEPLIDALDQIEASAGRMAQQLDGLVDAHRLASGWSVDLQ